MSSANNEFLYGSAVGFGRTLSYASPTALSELRLAAHSGTPDRIQVTVPTKTPKSGRFSG